MAAEEFDIQKRYEKKKEEERKKEKGIVDDKKKIVQIIKLEVAAGAAKPGPPIGPVLGQHQLNTAEFCKEFNKLTEKMEQGTGIPVLIFKKADRTFEIKLKAPSTTFYRKKFEKIGKCNTRGRFLSADVFVSVISPKVDVAEDSEKNIGNKKLEMDIKLIKTILSSFAISKIKNCKVTIFFRKRKKTI